MKYFKIFYDYGNIIGLAAGEDELQAILAKDHDDIEYTAEISQEEYHQEVEKAEKEAQWEAERDAQWEAEEEEEERQIDEFLSDADAVKRLETLKNEVATQPRIKGWKTLIENKILLSGFDSNINFGNPRVVYKGYVLGHFTYDSEMGFHFIENF